MRARRGIILITTLIITVVVLLFLGGRPWRWGPTSMRGRGPPGS